MTSQTVVRIIAMNKKELYREIKLYGILGGVLICVLTLAFYYSWNALQIVNLGVLAIVLSAAMYFDFKLRIIPNEILLVALVSRVLILGSFLLFNAQNLPSELVGSILGALFVAAVLFIGRLLNNGIGAGDIKMFFIVGLFMGLDGSFRVLFYTVFASFLYAVYALTTKKLTLKDSLPMAPFAVAGFFITIILGGA